MSSSQPLGIVLAGGAGRRLGGTKPSAMLGGRPLAEWVARALAQAVGEVAVVAKEETELPALGSGVAIWREPAQPRHPLVGIVWALRQAGGRAVLVCPVDLPFADADVLQTLLATAPTAAVVIAAGQPLLGRYAPSVAPALQAAVAADGAARAAVAALSPVEVDVEDPARTLFNVNTPEDLARAEAMLAGARRAGG